MNINSGDLIRLIVWHASGRGERLTTLRLVKFLYLADLYNARCTEGKTLTGWPWAFVYFGPFCQRAKESIEESVKAGLIQCQEYPSKYDDERDYRLFWVEDTDEEPNLLNSLHPYVWSRLQWAIQKWADDSFGLLDYIYFETEPMVEAGRGDVLDFSKAQMPEVPKRIEMNKIPKAKVEAAKKAVNRLKEKYKKATVSRPSQGPIDALFLKAVNQLEGEDLEVGLQGTAELGDLEPDRKP